VRGLLRQWWANQDDFNLSPTRPAGFDYVDVIDSVATSARYEVITGRLWPPSTGQYQFTFILSTSGSASLVDMTSGLRVLSVNMSSSRVVDLSSSTTYLITSTAMSANANDFWNFVSWTGPGLASTYAASLRVCVCVCVCMCVCAFVCLCFLPTTHHHPLTLPRSTLGAPFTQPPLSANCSAYTSCRACAMDAGCGWCESSCVPRSNASACAVSLAISFAACPICAEHTDCRSCTRRGCGWMYDSCVNINSNPLLITNTSTCPRRCFDRATCSECLAPDATFSSLLCGWCSSSNQCLDFGLYTQSDPFGQCSAWYRSDSNPCPLCSVNTNSTAACDICIGQRNCGWSYLTVCVCVCGGFMCLVLIQYNTHTHTHTHTHIGRDALTAQTNPLRGSCTTGDYVGPTSMLALLPPTDINPRVSPAGNGSLAIEALNTSLAWAVLQCPPLNECALGIANCSANAVCIDLPNLFNCSCLPGYRAVGTGFPGSAANPCLPVCSSCFGGRCVAPETCACDPGWAGANCTLDCGCNFHAVCPANFTSLSDPAEKVCSPCLHNTSGSRCETCLPGFFGDARRGGACSPCQCNGHGNASRGLCNMTTGACFCLDYTQGATCSICLPTFYGVALNGGTCYSLATANSRVELMLPRGGLGTGTTLSYLSNALSTWIIRAPANTSLITLSFSRLSTECSYDYIHIYDAESPLSPSARLLATFSGLNSPAPLYSTTGTMLVIFFSDEDFELTGFEAVYTISTCNEYCRNGTCVDSKCVCHPGFSGPTCEIAHCPNNCSAALGRGMCAADSSHCICSPGYLGLSCNRSVANATWASLPATPTGPFTARSGHCAVYDALGDRMLTFGGYDLNTYFNDVLELDFTSSTWATLSNNTNVNASAESHDIPSGRHLHTCVLYHSTLAVYGGAPGPSLRSSELWFFDLDTLTWTVYTPPPVVSFAPPQVMGHAAVLAASDMYVFGGLVRGIGYYTALYKFNFISQLWSLVPALGNPLATFGLTGLYYPRRNSIVFYGGRRQYSVNTAERTGAVREYLIDNNTWVADAQYSPDCGTRSTCNGRQLASAVLYEDLMVIFGGNPFEHTATTECTTNSLLVYNLACQTWLTNATSLLQPNTPRRRAAHRAILRNATMIVVGGYSGTVLDSIVTYAIPPNYCGLHSLRNACLWDPQCAWNETARQCLAKSALSPASNLTNITRSSNCPASTCSLRTTQTESIDLCTLCSSGPCNFCSRTGECTAANATSPNTCGTSLVTAVSQCNRCTSRTSCADCALAGCQWSAVPGCIVGPATNISMCPPRCSSLTTCDACRRAGSCSWCSATSSCMPFFAVTTEYSFGQCLRYTTLSACDLNSVCAVRPNCTSCLSAPFCGWCASSAAANSSGTCAAGTAIGPGLFALSTNTTCSATSPLPLNSTWSAVACPDVNECLLGTHRCSQNASCVNEDPSVIRESRGYRCVCACVGCVCACVCVCECVCVCVCECVCVSVCVGCVCVCVCECVSGVFFT
jgi:multipile epidermal growth factor-like domains protein 8